MIDSIQNPILLINKPPGPTSHDIVAIIRKRTGVTRVGHAGTLDPFAEGLLIILVGREKTKQQAEFLGMDKTYEAVLHLGATSTTEDPTGIISENPNAQPIPFETICTALESFVGTFDQMPSSFSAKKINGAKAYTLARRGIQPDLKPKTITIYSIDLLSYDWPFLSIRCTVSSGTYIRALARDIGERLGCGGYVEKLRRTTIGPYSLNQAVTLSEVESRDMN